MFSQNFPASLTFNSATAHFLITFDIKGADRSISYNGKFSTYLIF